MVFSGCGWVFRRWLWEDYRFVILVGCFSFSDCWWWWGCQFGFVILVGYFSFFAFCLLVVMRLWVWVCDFGGWGLWLWEVVAMAFVVAMVAARWWVFFWWWWLAVPSCGCGYGFEFAWIEKKVVALFKERERQIRRERKKHSERIKIIIFKWSCKKIEPLMFDIL